jgi:two-component system nitrogen regulation sensor histidine kinase NtrY
VTVTAAGTLGKDRLRRSMWGAFNAPSSAIALGALSIGSVLLTYLTISGQMPFAPTPEIVLTLVIVNFLLVLVLTALIAVRLASIWNQRRSGFSGSRLHGRLVAIFSAIAIIPAVLTAAIAAYSINLGVEAWFSQGVRTAIDNSIAVAEAYLEEHKRNINANIVALSSEMERGLFDLETAPARFETAFFFAAQATAFDGAALFGAQGQRIMAVSKPNTFIIVDRPTDEDYEVARRGEVSLTTEQDGSQVRAFKRISATTELYVMGVRNIDARVIGYQRETQRVVEDYRRLDRSRTGAQISLGLIYAVIALVLLIASIFVGVWAANRIVAPITRLVSAAERVSRGDLTARVPLDRSDDEVATLSFAFNRMTGELESQREELVESHRQTEVRRRFTEAVLSGVSAGVMGLDADGRINILNRSAQTMLGMGRDPVIATPIEETAPELAGLVAAARENPEGRAQGQVDVTRAGTTRNLTVRVTSETPTEGERGFVVTFDDITDLINAQRSTAWSDVARRIAHEIKNPLTPIQLSAERLRRKYRKEIATDPEVFEQCTQTIIRQVSDIGRMVDEFSSFARMPQPVMRVEDIGELVKHATFLQRVALPQIEFDMALPADPATLVCDGRLVSQALTNVLKNAGEAVKARFSTEAGADIDQEQFQAGGRIEIRLLETADTLTVEVCDNGIGLPKEDRHRLTEPYVTKRVKGTGLGLAIVKKIMEDHQGRIALDDAPDLDATGAPRGAGARVRLTFPKSLKPATASEQTLSRGTGNDDEQSRPANTF